MSRSKHAATSILGRLRYLWKAVWGVARRDALGGLELSLRSELRARFIELLLLYRRFLLVVCLLLLLLLLIPAAKILTIAWGKQGYPPHFYVMAPLIMLIGISGFTLSVFIITALLCAFTLVCLLLFGVLSMIADRLVLRVVSRVLGLDARGLQIIASRVNWRLAPLLEKVGGLALAAFGGGAIVVLWLFGDMYRLIEYAHVIGFLVVVIVFWAGYRVRGELLRGQDRQYVRASATSNVVHIPLVCLVLAVIVFVLVPLSIRVITAVSERLLSSVARPAFIVGKTKAAEYVEADPSVGGLRRKVTSREEIVAEADELTRNIQADARKLQVSIEEVLNSMKPSVLTLAILMVIGGVIVPIVQLRGARAVAVAIVTSVCMFAVSLSLRRRIASIFPSGDNAIVVMILLCALTVTIAFAVNVMVQALGRVERSCRACMQENPCGARYCISCGNVFTE